MEKKKYESLEISVVMFGKKDVLAASGDGSGTENAVTFGLRNNQTEVIAVPDWL